MRLLPIAGLVKPDAPTYHAKQKISIYKNNLAKLTILDPGSAFTDVACDEGRCN